MTARLSSTKSLNVELMKTCSRFATAIAKTLDAYARTVGCLGRSLGNALRPVGYLTLIKQIRSRVAVPRQHVS